MSELSDKQRGAAKTARNPIKIVQAERLPKPDWIRVKAPSPGTRFYEVKRILRAHGYPPDMQQKATDTVIAQAELIAKDWAA